MEDTLCTGPSELCDVCEVKRLTGSLGPSFSASASERPVHRRIRVVLVKSSSAGVLQG
jgi:hypothetical protein